MPDDLPPLQPQPDSTSVPLDALQHAAQWAGTFGGQDTNVAQRARHNQDITAYAGALANQRAQEQQQLIQTNQTAQNLFLGTQRLQLQEQQAQMHMAVQAAQLQATGATERRKAAEAVTQANATAGLNQGMSDLLQSGVSPQSPQYQQGLANLLAQFPQADPAHIAKFGATMFPGQKMSPDDYIAAAVKMKNDAIAQGLQNPRVVESQGSPKIIEAPGAKVQDPSIRLSHLESLRSKATDPDIVKYLDNEITSTHTRITTPAVVPAASTPPPDITPEAHSALKLGDKFWWKGKQLTKQ